MRAHVITLIVNGEPRDSHAETLSDLVVAEGYGDQRVATALNGVFVPLREREHVRLNAGDRIEIVSARQGG